MNTPETEKKRKMIHKLFLIKIQTYKQHRNHIHSANFVISTAEFTFQSKLLPWRWRQ